MAQVASYALLLWCKHPDILVYDSLCTWLDGCPVKSYTCRQPHLIGSSRCPEVRKVSRWKRWWERSRWLQIQQFCAETWSAARHFTLRREIFVHWHLDYQVRWSLIGGQTMFFETSDDGFRSVWRVWIAFSHLSVCHARDGAKSESFQDQGEVGTYGGEKTVQRGEDCHECECSPSRFNLVDDKVDLVVRELLWEKIVRHIVWAAWNRLTPAKPSWQSTFSDSRVIHVDQSIMTSPAPFGTGALSLSVLVNTDNSAFTVSCMRSSSLGMSLPL